MEREKPGERDKGRREGGRKEKKQKGEMGRKLVRGRITENKAKEKRIRREH